MFFWFSFASFFFTFALIVFRERLGREGERDKRNREGGRERERERTKRVRRGSFFFAKCFSQFFLIHFFSGSVVGVFLFFLFFFPLLSFFFSSFISLWRCSFSAAAAAGAS